MVDEGIVSILTGFTFLSAPSQLLLGFDSAVQSLHWLVTSAGSEGEVGLSEL